MAAGDNRIDSNNEVVPGWIAIEIACKSCLEKGCEAIDQSLNLDFDPDGDEINTPLNTNPDLQQQSDPQPKSSISSTTIVIKAIRFFAWYLFM
ncbi:unnamed protein product [Dovyalis caffra]|uniref:Uncharacterized protein n=1 Tax=Dovyalis caffra TaxID=77055 RepID=A0AAV1QVB9_9ROSI|nr:unnamed protein product [Dovyalis caffra]